MSTSLKIFQAVLLSFYLNLVIDEVTFAICHHLPSKTSEASTDSVTTLERHMMTVVDAAEELDKNYYVNSKISWKRRSNTQFGLYLWHKSEILPDFLITVQFCLLVTAPDMSLQLYRLKKTLL